MIFYFSGTGNSRYAAEKLAQHLNEENIFNISECVKNEKFSFSLKENEDIGFVFPVYYDGLPSLLVSFLNKLEIKATPETYIYTVVTCGAAMGSSAYALKMALSERWLFLTAAFKVVMPDNYIMIYNPCEKEHAKAKIKNADRKFEEISEKIKNREVSEIEINVLGQTKYDIMQKLYHKMRKTKKFYADENCISCGKCVEVCPINCIELKNGKPEWKAEKCVHCTACINRCPKNALQYSKRTINRNRYSTDKL